MYVQSLYGWLKEIQQNLKTLKQEKDISNFIKCVVSSASNFKLHTFPEIQQEFDQIKMY